MTTWIFQANPDHYDIDGRLSAGFPELQFIVTRQAQEMKAGDQVFIWRSQGRDKHLSGLIAETTMIAEPARSIDDPESQPFWTDATRAVEPALRAPLLVNQVANKDRTIRKEWLIADPVLRDLTILKTANSTNFKVPSEQAKRLMQLWTMTGADWSRDDCIAGLYAYQQTKGGAISKLPGSPVADVAMLIGRAVPGVYNKVMNFRHLDPDDSRKGMSAGGRMTEDIWNEFYRPEKSGLDVTLLESELARLWHIPNASQPFSEIKTIVQKSIETADKFTKTMTLPELEQAVAKRTKSIATKPNKKRAITTVYERDPWLVALRRARADNHCEVPNCAYPAFLAKDGSDYCEVHHIVPLSDGGSDTLENMICLCPSHHVEAHRGKNADELKATFEKVREASA